MNFGERGLDGAEPMLNYSDYQCDSDLAIEALVRHEGPLLLDFDETAYLRNSTEDFLDTASPGLVALVLLRLLDSVRPWRWTGGEVTRDLWRVHLVTMLMPWTWMMWRRRVNTLATQFANYPLLAAVRQRQGSTIFVTAGFQPIVAPLIAALGFPEAPIVACRLNTSADRLRGKLPTTVDALGEEVVKKSAVLTDSLSDLPLLNNCALPLFTIWREAQYRRAFSDVYVPGQYLTQIKRPGERYITRGILLEDFALWVLCSIFYTTSPFAHVIGLLALLISFWAIYELGYVENDWVAHLYERAWSSPKAIKDVGAGRSLLDNRAAAALMGQAARRRRTIRTRCPVSPSRKRSYWTSSGRG